METYKAYENKPPDLLRERVDIDFSSRVRASKTSEMGLRGEGGWRLILIHMENILHSF